MLLSSSPNAIRLRARRAALKAGKPWPVLTHEERKKLQHKDAPKRAKKGWQTRRMLGGQHPMISRDDEERCVWIWIEKNPGKPIPPWFGQE